MISNNDSENAVISPGSTIGIFGSGQLGKMTAIVAKQMGYYVHVFSPSHDSPAGQVADLEIQASYDDLAAVERFAKQVDVVTLEFENIPIQTLEVAGRFAPVRPGIKALQTTQNRSVEKNFLRDLKIPTCEFQIVKSLDELRVAAEQMLPSILKTTCNGYDGKGQAVIRTLDDVQSAWEDLNTDEAILEEMIDFDFEFSIVAARNYEGLFAAYPSIRNEHQNQILDVSISPSGINKTIESQAIEIASRIMDALKAVGVVSVEFFYRGGEILVNEIAPRTHNSGHLTIEGHATSQFEQHVRAICGLALGSTQQTKPAAMANILGDQWKNGDPHWHLALTIPNVKLHLYGKGLPEPNRKMGHLTATANSPEEASEQVKSARQLLTSNCSNSDETKQCQTQETNDSR